MKEKKGVSGRAVKVVVLVLMAVTLGAGIWMFVMENGALPTAGNTAMVFEETDIVERYDMDSRAQIYTYKDGKGFFIATRDGIRFIASDGREKMSCTYNMTTPRLAGRGGYAGVAEENGMSLYVCNAEGRLYTATTENPILSFSVAANGYAVVITQKDDSYDVVVFNTEGKMSHYGLFVEANVYPVAADVSNDGRILAVSYLDTSGGEMNSRILFSYVNKTEAADYAAANGVFAAVEYNPDRLVGMVRFMENNVLLALSDKDMVCYDAENGARRKWSMDLGNKLDALCVSEAGWFAIAYGSRNPNISGEEPGLCRFYDLNMTVLGEYKAGAKVTQLSAGYNTVLVCCERQYTAVARSGNELWQYDATHDVSQALFMENANKLVLAGSTQTGVIQRVKEKTEAETDAPVSGTPVDSTGTGLTNIPAPTEQAEETPEPSEDAGGEEDAETMPSPTPMESEEEE